MRRRYREADADDDLRSPYYLRQSTLRLANHHPMVTVTAHPVGQQRRVWEADRCLRRELQDSDDTRYKAHGNVIELTVPDNRTPPRGEIEKLQIYLYTIANLPQDRWVKNDNVHNKLLTEWKTQSTITAGIVSQEQVDLVAWLAPKRLNFNFDDEEQGGRCTWRGNENRVAGRQTCLYAVNSGLKPISDIHHGRGTG